jgi:hypothetical protein
MARSFLNKMSAGFALASGTKGFFGIRPIAPWLQPAGTIEATSLRHEPSQAHSRKSRGLRFAQCGQNPF